MKKGESNHSTRPRKGRRKEGRPKEGVPSQTSRRNAVIIHIVLTNRTLGLLLEPKSDAAAMEPVNAWKYRKAFACDVLVGANNTHDSAFIGPRIVVYCGIINHRGKQLLQPSFPSHPTRGVRGLFVLLRLEEDKAPQNFTKICDEALLSQPVFFLGNPVFQG